MDAAHYAFLAEEAENALHEILAEQCDVLLIDLPERDVLLFRANAWLRIATPIRAVVDSDSSLVAERNTMCSPQAVYLKRSGDKLWATCQLSAEELTFESLRHHLADVCDVAEEHVSAGTN